MAIVPWRKREDWDPFRELENLQQNMNKLFNSSLSRWPETAKSVFSGFDWAPSVDVEDKKDKIVVKAELPGMDKNDVKITLEDDALIISGEKKHEEEKDDKEKGYYHRECSYGSFKRLIEIPSAIDKSKVDASYKNGVLKIILPKTEEAKPKQIDIDIK